MKLRATQIAGLGAIVVFGGILIVTLTRGPRDPALLPSGVRISDLPAVSAPAIDTTPLPEDPLAVGSQEAKDDLYCSGVVFAVHQSKPMSFTPDTQKRLDAVTALAEAGAGKLKAEGIATDATTAGIADAHTDKAAADFSAGSPRISFADCMARAAALPAAPAAN